MTFTSTEKGSWVLAILSFPLTLAMVTAWVLAASAENTHWLVLAAVFVAFLASLLMFVGAVSHIRLCREVRRDPLAETKEIPAVKRLLNDLRADFDVSEPEVSARRYTGVLTGWMGALFVAVWLERESARIEMLATNGVLGTAWNLIASAAVIVVAILFLYLWRLKEDERESAQP